MINLGLIKYSYKDSDKIEITKYGKKALKNEKEVELVRVGSGKEYISVEPKIEVDKREDNLFKKLRKLRNNLAQDRGVAPYMIYNDSTLEEMAERKPLTKDQLKNISGIGAKKLERYGKDIIEAIANYIKENKDGFKQKKVVFASYQLGKNIRKIKQDLEIKKEEIYKEVTRLYRKGYDLDINNFISQNSLEKIMGYLNEEGVPGDLSDVNELVKQDLSEEKINLILTHFEKNN